jgi:hypothetical protein
MESEDSLPYLQEPATGPYPRSDEPGLEETMKMKIVRIFDLLAELRTRGQSNLKAKIVFG